MADRLSDLSAMKALVEESIHAADPEKRASLVAQWRAIEKDIADLSRNSKKAGDPIDEIASRRAARGAVAAPVQHRAAADSS